VNYSRTPVAVGPEYRLATGWTVRGSNPGGSEIFRTRPYRPLGPTQPPVQWVPGLSPGVKRPGRGADHPPPSMCRGHERVELYLYSPSGPSWPIIGRTLPFTPVAVMTAGYIAQLAESNTRLYRLFTYDIFFLN
jgi:hypothetical protein